MLQFIHDKATGIFAIIILAALTVTFVFWGVDASVGTFTQAQGLEVNGEELGAQGVRQSYQDELARYQQAFGDREVPEELRNQVRDAVLEQAIRAALIRQQTEALRYVASNQQVLAQIREIPAFQVDGRFSTDAYHAALRSVGIEPAQFENEQREAARARQLDRGIFTSAFFLPGELQRRVALRDESREIAWVVLPAARFEPGVTLSETELEAWFAAHRGDYMTEESARVEYVELSLAELAATAEFGEAELRAWYEENIARFAAQDRRRARHILFEGAEGDTTAEAGARAAYERARQGEDFAALARELSADAGSAPAGGDLGWAERNTFVGPFGDAVWAMQPGEIRGPVRSEFGWHVIKLEEVEGGVKRSFEDVRAEIEPEARRAAVETLFGDRQELLDTAAFEAAGNLGEVAGRLGLPIKVVERYTRGSGGALGESPAVASAVFAPDTIAGRELRTVELAPGRVVALRVAAHQPAVERPLDEVRAEVVAAARMERAQQLAVDKATAVVAELEQGAGWEAVTRPWMNPEAATHQPQLRRRSDGSVPAAVRDAAFKAAWPDAGPRFGSVALASGDAAIWRLTGVRPGSLATLAAEDQQQKAQEARDQLAFQDASAYVRALRARADVEVNPNLFE